MFNMLVITTTVLVCLFCYSNAIDWGKYDPIHMALNSKVIECDRNRNVSLDVSDITVYFYDFSNNNFKVFKIKEAAKGILKIENLDKSRKTVCYVGGYKSHINKNNEVQVRETFKSYPNSYLIMTDHSPYTNDKHGFIKSYERAVKYVYYIGKAVGEMLAELEKGGISAKNMHCIGHSLGGQILGFAGTTFINITHKKIGRIVALDPAGPCFANGPISDQIRSGVAEYVEVYHCNSGGFGSASVLADIDFFVNKKGQSQPDCGTQLIPGMFHSVKTAICSHRTCVQVYLATVTNPNLFSSWKCSNYKTFKKGSCSNNARTKAGFWNSGLAKGIFYFSTKGYALG